MYKDGSCVTCMILLYNPALITDIANWSQQSLLLDLASRRLFSSLVSPWQLGVLQFTSILKLPWVSSTSHNLRAKSSVRLPELQTLFASRGTHAHFLPICYKSGDSHNSLRFCEFNNSQNPLKAQCLWLWFYHKRYVLDRAWKGLGCRVSMLSPYRVRACCPPWTSVCPNKEILWALGV